MRRADALVVNKAATKCGPRMVRSTGSNLLQQLICQRGYATAQEAPIPSPFKHGCQSGPRAVMRRASSFGGPTEAASVRFTPPSPTRIQRAHHFQPTPPKRSPRASAATTARLRIYSSTSVTVAFSDARSFRFLARLCTQSNTSGLLRRWL